MHGGHVRLLAAAATVVTAALALGLVFAGSPGRIAEGVRIAGVDVGGLTPQAARALLERRAASRAEVPVTFVAGSQRWQIRPSELGVERDWATAVAAAARKGQGFSVLRGYRRLGLRLFPANVEPTVRAYNSAVDYQVVLLAADIDRPHRDARLVRRGLTFEAVPAQAGRLLDRSAARRIVIDALAGFSHSAVALPVRVDRPRVTLARLARARVLANRVVSAPVTLKLGTTSREVSPRRLAAMLRLPEAGAGALTLGGPAANRYFASLDRAVGTPARDASFDVTAGGITIVPSQVGLGLDVPRTAAAVLAAAERKQARVARLVVTKVEPRRTTAEARAMGITGVVSSYETIYGGVANRIHNVQLVAQLLDGTLIAPGATFSFNDTTGERTADKGFLEAPVIINGELQTGLGGGICQVSTTVFNAAYEAGLPIVSRTNHALYISHYPLGRDATVNYPDLDLKFVNDTGKWLLLRTFVGSSSLVVNLYGSPQNRRVETETAPLRVLAPPPIEKRVDKSLPPGKVVVEEYGVPAQATSVQRRVYSADGKLLSDATWYSSYRAEPKIVVLGPKKKQKPKAAAEPAPPVKTPVRAPPQ